MAQVVATRPIQSSLLCPSSRSFQHQFDKNIKPYCGFSSNSLIARRNQRKGLRVTRVNAPILAKRSARAETEVLPVSPEDVPKMEEKIQYLREQLGDSSVSMWAKPTVRRKTKIVCTIGPSTNTKEMIWSLAEAGMNVARLNMSHGDHASHQIVIDLVKEYNSQNKDNVIAIMLDTKGPEVRSGDLPQPIMLASGQEFTFTIQRGVGTADTVSVNYDDFVNDVEVGDMLLVDGGMMSLVVKSKTEDSVKCEVVDGGELKSRRHLNVRGKSATLPSITEKDWDDIKFGVDNKVDFYAVSFVKDAAVIHELKNYLQSCGADIHVIPKIESADSIPNLHSIITASDGAMVARGDLGAELPIEEVPLLQEEIISICHSMGKAVIVATNMLESMIVHPTPTRAQVSDIAIAVREGADAVMLSGETAHGKPLTMGIGIYANWEVQESRIATMKLVCHNVVGNCISNCPGIVSISHIEELGLILTGMLKKYADGEVGMLTETFSMACSILVTVMKSPSSHGTSNFSTSLQDASIYATRMTSYSGLGLNFPVHLLSFVMAHIQGWNQDFVNLWVEVGFVLITSLHYSFRVALAK